MQDRDDITVLKELTVYADGQCRERIYCGTLRPGLESVFPFVPANNCEHRGGYVDIQLPVLWAVM